MLEVVEVLIRFPQLGQRFKGSRVNRCDFFVCGLFVLHVHLIPLFEQFDSFFSPGYVGFCCQFIHGCVLELGSPKETNRLLAVEVVNVCGVRDLVLNAISNKNTCVGATFEEHRSENCLFIS